MWPLVKAILVKLGILRGLLAILGSLAAVLPLAIALLKVLGLPLLIVMLVLGLPLLLVLFLIGFPLIAVLAIGGIAMGLAVAAITFGVMLLKFFLFIVVPIWLAWRVARWAFRRGGGERHAPDAPQSAGEAM